MHSVAAVRCNAAAAIAGAKAVVEGPMDSKRLFSTPLMLGGRLVSLSSTTISSVPFSMANMQRKPRLTSWIYDAELISTDERLAPARRLLPLFGSCRPSASRSIHATPIRGRRSQGRARPGIGGFKANSEIGVGHEGGARLLFHQGFLPEPQPGQTIEDICERQRPLFLETVIARHPEAEGSPASSATARRDWAVMILAALSSGICSARSSSPASPLSYWAGVEGPESDALFGRIAGRRLADQRSPGDLGAATSTAPSWYRTSRTRTQRTRCWTKQYNLYSKIDTEAGATSASRRWWGRHRHAQRAGRCSSSSMSCSSATSWPAGEIRTSDGTADRPAQHQLPIVRLLRPEGRQHHAAAAGAGLDPGPLRRRRRNPRARPDHRLYACHEKVGHLGIFVSAGVARKEHDEFASNIDFIDLLPPGLYEAVLEPKGAAIDNPDLVTGEWLMRCEACTLSMISGARRQLDRG